MPLDDDCDTVKNRSTLAGWIKYIEEREGPKTTAALMLITGRCRSSVCEARRELAEEHAAERTDTMRPAAHDHAAERMEDAAERMADSRAHAKDSNNILLINTTPNEDSFLPTPERASRAKRATGGAPLSRPVGARAASVEQEAMAAALRSEPPCKDVARNPDGSLVLSEAERARWRPRFGTDDHLDLALMQAAGYVQAHSGVTLKLQVNAQLSRMAREREERDQRYKAAKAAGDSSQSWVADLIRETAVVQ